MESSTGDLFAAIKSGDLDKVKALVSADRSLVDARTGTGESAVLTAVYHGRREIANLLVARGAVLTLFEACAAGEYDRAERLVESGADVNAFSQDGWTPLHLAAFFGHPKLVELLLGRSADVAARSRNANGNTPLHAALAANRTLVVGLLVGAGADVNAVDAAGWRPLHLAAAGGDLNALKALVAQGAEVGGVNRDGLTPLAIARQKNHAEAAAFLERHTRS
jgi:ankyrin repeat protein